MDFSYWTRLDWTQDWTVKRQQVALLSHSLILSLGYSLCQDPFRFCFFFFHLSTYAKQVPCNALLYLHLIPTILWIWYGLNIKNLIKIITANEWIKQEIWSNESILKSEVLLWTLLFCQMNKMMQVLKVIYCNAHGLKDNLKP